MAIDYMFPAVTAVTSTIVYLIHQLLHRPEVEEKMVQEIEYVVGKGRLPTLDDRQKWVLLVRKKHKIVLIIKL